MSVQSYPTGLIEVQEIILLQSRYTMSVPASTGNQTDTIAHNLGRSPFIDYSWSYDGNIYIPPIRGFNIDTSDPNLHYLSAYTDSTNVYFSFGSQSTPLALTLYIRYKLFVTEAT